MGYIELHFGASANPLKSQLKAQGYRPRKEDLICWQKLADAVTMLAVHDFLNDRQRHAMRQKLLKVIARALAGEIEEHK